jgi:hypothetical protein
MVAEMLDGWPVIGLLTYLAEVMVMVFMSKLRVECQSGRGVVIRKQLSGVSGDQSRSHSNQHI